MYQALAEDGTPFVEVEAINMATARHTIKGLGTMNDMPDYKSWVKGFYPIREGDDNFIMHWDANLQLYIYASQKDPYAKVSALVDRAHERACEALQILRNTAKGHTCDEDMADAVQALFDAAATLQVEVNGAVPTMLTIGKCMQDKYPVTV